LERVWYIASRPGNSREGKGEKKRKGRRMGSCGQFTIADIALRKAKPGRKESKNRRFFGVGYERVRKKKKEERKKGGRA